MITLYKISAIRYWRESGKLKKNGDPVLKPNDVRKITIHGDFTVALKEGSFYRTAQAAGFRATIVKRKGERYVSVIAIIKPEKAWWDKSSIQESELKEKHLDRFSFPEFEQWLTSIGIMCADAVVSELQTIPPISRAEAEVT